MDVELTHINQPKSGKMTPKERLALAPVCSQFFRADLCRRLGPIPEARASYEKALALARQEPGRHFLASGPRN